ncbi:MAG: hypothetical protein JWP88_2100 [Flaviaesturariibacter sp.]|nr:hypothetical protein [Flaviaesturariibacter sp.]
MSFFTRLSNGWTIAMNSFKVLRANKQLIVFPILSGVSLVLVMGSFVTAILAGAGWEIDAVNDGNTVLNYLMLFGFYLVNYFIITFFNMALVHCTHLYFTGEEVSVQKGLQFSASRLRVILSWALFAATVGTILKVLQENLGWIGKIITGLMGIVWSVATFFVVPVIAYEDLGPIDAFKRSAQLMKEKWGESLGSRLGFGVVNLVAFLLVAVPLFIIGAFIHILVGIGLALLGTFLIMTIMSAAHTIFISAVYHNVTGHPVEHFNQQLIDNLFESN